jgi:hypothetical protein
MGSNKENSPRHNPKKCLKNIAAKDLNLTDINTMKVEMYKQGRYMR